MNFLYRESKMLESEAATVALASQGSVTHIISASASSVALSFHRMMRISHSAAGWVNTHLVPVVRKLFATLKANNIGTCLLRSSRPGLTGSGREWETEASVPAAEQNVSQIEVRMHDILLTPS